MNIDLVKSIANSLVDSRPGWSMVRYIDAGASGAVFEITHPDHGAVALKVYDPKFFVGDDALIEVRRVELQRDFKGHGNAYLIEIYEAEPIPEAGTYYMLMELCPWDSMEKVLDDLPNERIQELLRQLVEAVSFLDSRQLVHRDIKPANIAVAADFSALKLLDLGVMRRIGPGEGVGTDLDEKRRFIATAQYSPPEYLSREEAKGEEGFDALNVYQVGAVLHDMIMKRPLFAKEAGEFNRYILYKAITSQRPAIFNPGLPARLISLCRAALEKDPTKRLASVKLSDMSKSIDSAEVVRRRLAANLPRASEAAHGLSLTIWAPQVRQWIKAAVKAEKEVLGPCLLADVPTPEGGATWKLSLPNIGRSLTLHLSRADDGEYLSLAIGDAKATDGAPLLEVYGSRPTIDRPAIITQLQEQILFALDGVDESSRPEGE